MIIEVDFKSPEIKRVFSKKNSANANYCRHPQMLIDEHLRELSCEKCGKIIDAYEYVASLAKKEDRLFTSINHLQREERSMLEKIEALKKELKNIKARVNTAKKTNPPAIAKKFAGFAELKEKLK